MEELDKIIKMLKKQKENEMIIEILMELITRINYEVKLLPVSQTMTKTFVSDIFEQIVFDGTYTKICNKYKKGE